MRNLVLIGEGNHRYVYSHGQNVIKVPRSRHLYNGDILNGIADNEREARISAKYGRNPDQNGIYYARCHILKTDGW